MDNINFFVPAEIDLVKANNPEDSERRIIRGYASTSSKDRQDEEIVQKGLDIQEFLDYGWFNYDHDNTKILGYPIKKSTRVTSDGFYVEGELLKGVALADSLWEVAVALKKSNAPRKLGFSVEGKVLQRDASNRILKAKIYNVAITPNPVNTTATWDIIAKSFTEETEIIKSAEAGYGSRIGEESTGSSLIKESLDSSLSTSFTNLAKVLDEEDESKDAKKKLKEILVKKSLTDNEIILFLQLYKGMSRQSAIDLIKNLS